MAVNKVVFGETTVMDITDTTATPDTVLSGVTFYGASGEQMVGESTAKVSDVYVNGSSVLDSENIAQVTVPTTLSQLSADSTHRLVTDAEKQVWGGKQDAITDLATIRSGAGLGATAVQPSSLGAVATSNDYDDLDNLPSIPSVVDNVTSTSTTQALSVNQGKLLNDRINNISTRGRFLSLWNCVTGLPLTNPSGYPYTYHTGDFFIVNNTGSTNYIPNGSSYTGVASTTVYSGTIKVNDTIFYDGTTWSVFDTPAESGGVQDVYVNGTSVVSSGIANVSVPPMTQTITSSSATTETPSAKAVYNLIGDIASALASL